VAPVPEVAIRAESATHQPDDAKIDAEWDRFLTCAVPTPNGNGLHDPSESPDWPTGIRGELWDDVVAIEALRRERRQKLRAGRVARKQATTPNVETLFGERSGLYA